tara:strand:- start:70 stop:378 length:309 start_codon:yes stop_codon:yes gene_type:complete
MKKFILFKSLFILLVVLISSSCYSNKNINSVATLTLINNSCADCHIKLMEDLDSYPGINESDGFISQDSSIIVINVSYNMKLTSIEEINSFIISQGFDIYSK